MNTQTRITNKSIRKKKRKRRIFFFITLPLTLILLSGITYGAFLFAKAANIMEASNQELKRGDQSAKRVEKVSPKHDNISVLIMGVDDSGKRQFGSATRTDSLILATFNRNDKSVKMVSIPRDSYVYVPVEGKKDKITHAHAFGGVDGTIETVEETFDIPVDYFVKLNFDAFIDVVEALGGITVDVPVTFTEQDSKDRGGAITLYEGKQHLDGEQALALARTRKIDNDIERGKRQQLVLKAIIDKAISAGSITKYGELMQALGDNISTNFKFGEILSLYDYALTGLDIESLTLEGADSYIGRVYYYQLDEHALANMSNELKEHLGLKASDVKSTTE
ncbi:LCP family protein [Bacillus sp. B-jedd]|uniref:LCP family protein n=1 Tax=Bacillus sp. B-jedd TaxID=1476857 RepID=UPI0005155823|nr:LCP family protein [Bacillus sp. B-jedd]CEG29080.1 membrane bound transcriptional regulator [Bacillus sp. B-jedd]